jgi:hypothetical protein
MRTSVLILAILAGGLRPGELPAQFCQTTTALSRTSEELLRAIVQKGYRRVGVFPQCTGRQGAGDAESFSGPTAAHAKLFAERLQEALVRQSAGRFEVISQRVMGKACEGIAIGDLGDPKRLQELAERVGGMDALVVGTVTEQHDLSSGQQFFDVRSELIEVSGGASGSVSTERLAVSIAGLAYSGRSFELRRWSGGTLENVGLRREAEGRAFLAGDYNPASGLSPADILPDQCHPLDDPECPFGLEILVDGKPRPRQRVGRDVYVALERGERFGIGIQNRSGQDAYLALFVDGLNVLGKKRESPSNCRCWHVGKQDEYLFRGWYSGANTQYVEEAFEITSASGSEAGKQGFADSLGMITAVFYTIGVPPQTARPAPPPEGEEPMLRTRVVRNPETGRQETVSEARSLDPETGKWKWHRVYLSVAPGGQIGVRGAESRAVRLEEFRGDKPGLIMAAITVRYATHWQLEEMLRSAPSGAMAPAPRRPGLSMFAPARRPRIIIALASF